MLKYGNQDFRNLQEQVGKNKDDIALLKAGIKIKFHVTDQEELAALTAEEGDVAHVAAAVEGQPGSLYVYAYNEDVLAWCFLSQFPLGIKGEKGETGNTGNTGAKGPGIYGVTATLPDATNYQDGDMYALLNGDIYKLKTGIWHRQYNIKGPQGPIGDANVVASEIEGDPEHDVKLKSLEIDGVDYIAQDIVFKNYGDQDQYLQDALQAWANLGNIVLLKKDNNILFPITSVGKWSALIYKNSKFYLATATYNNTIWDYVEREIALPTFSAGPGIDISTSGSITYIELQQLFYEWLYDATRNVEWEQDGSATFGHDVYADGNLQAGNDVEIGRNLYIDDITKIQDPDGNQLAQGKLVAGTNITISGNTISATGGASYTAGTNITITNNTISAPNVATSTDLQQGLATRQPLGDYATTSQLNAKSTVTGTNDGTNWISLTVDGTTKNIPAGGGGGVNLYIHDIDISAIDDEDEQEYTINFQVISNSSSHYTFSSLSANKYGVYAALNNGEGNLGVIYLLDDETFGYQGCSGSYKYFSSGLESFSDIVRQL